MRVHTLSNPQAMPWSVPALSHDQIFSDPKLPLTLEIGTGQGLFFLEHAQKFLNQNHLGIELRKPLAEHLQSEIVKLGLKNAWALHGNVLPSMPALLGDRKLSELYIFFPDPWEKRAHAKRRLVQPGFDQWCAPFLNIGARVYFQTDVAALHRDFEQVFCTTEHFKAEKVQDWEEKLGFCQTNREKYMKKTGQAIFRSCYSKK